MEGPAVKSEFPKAKLCFYPILNPIETADRAQKRSIDRIPILRNKSQYTPADIAKDIPHRYLPPEEVVHYLCSR